MGRMLEALGQSVGSGGGLWDGPRDSLADAPPVSRTPASSPAPSPPPAPPAEEPGGGFIEDRGDVPFIEVGPDHLLEASPSVLAATPLRLRAPRPAPAAELSPPKLPAAEAPAQAAEPPVPRVDPPTVSLATPPLVGVGYRPVSRGADFLVPARGWSRDVLAFHQPAHPASILYRQLAATFLKERRRGLPLVVCLTALRAGAGVTTVVLNVAVSMVRGGGVRVVVLEANSRRPAIAERLGLRPHPGLAEVLAGADTVEQAVQDTGLADLRALTAGRPWAYRSLQCPREMARPVLRLLREQSDVVLVDAEPLEEIGAATGDLDAACDAVYLIVSQAEAEQIGQDERVRDMVLRGTPLRGCVITAR